MGHFHFLTLTVQTKRTGATNVQIRLFLKETQQLKKNKSNQGVTNKGLLARTLGLKLYSEMLGKKYNCTVMPIINPPKKAVWANFISNFVRNK